MSEDLTDVTLAIESLLTELLSYWVSDSTDLIDVTLVSDDTCWRVDWCFACWTVVEGWVTLPVWAAHLVVVLFSVRFFMMISYSFIDEVFFCLTPVFFWPCCSFRKESNNIFNWPGFNFPVPVFSPLEVCTLKNVFTFFPNLESENLTKKWHD